MPISKKFKDTECPFIKTGSCHDWCELAVKDVKDWQCAVKLAMGYLGDIARTLAVKEFGVLGAPFEEEDIPQKKIKKKK